MNNELLLINEQFFYKFNHQIFWKLYIILFLILFDKFFLTFDTVIMRIKYKFYNINYLPETYAFLMYR